MDLFFKILLALLLCFLIYGMYQRAKSQPEMFSKKALSKSFMTMGLLGLALIAFIWFLIIMVNN